MRLYIGFCLPKNITVAAGQRTATGVTATQKNPTLPAARRIVPLFASRQTGHLAPVAPTGGLALLIAVGGRTNAQRLTVCRTKNVCAINDPPTTTTSVVQLCCANACALMSGFSERSELA